MNIFDTSIIAFLNGFAGKSFFFDQATNLAAHTGLFKGGVMSAVLWWVWFKNDADSAKTHRHIVATVVASFFALFLARVLATTLPHRSRPIHNPDIVFHPPYGAVSNTLDGWSSFPSDHATLLFCLSTGLFFISRALGIITTFYLFIIIVLARIYLGLHYPTDLLAGACLGIGISWLANSTGIFDYFTNTGLQLYKNKPAWFFTLFFLITYQMATMFIDVRDLGSAAAKYFKIPPMLMQKRPA